MSARFAKEKDPLYGVAMSRCGGKCEVAKVLKWGVTDLHGNPNAGIVQVCGKPIEGILHQEDNVGLVGMCKTCRLQVFGMTSAEKRKRSIENKAAQTALIVRDKEKP